MEGCDGTFDGAVYIEKGEFAAENPGYREYLTITENGKVKFVEAKPVPKTDEPFEKYLNSI